MNKKIKIITVFLTLLSFTISAQSFKTANDYLDFVGKELTVITKNNWKYTKAIAHSKSDRNIMNKRKVLIKTVERAKLKIQRAEGFGGDTFKNHVLDLMSLNESLLKNDYAKIVDMKAVAEQSYDYMEAYILARELADKKMAEAQQNYETHFYAYTAEHNINIVESESDLGKKMKISGDVFEHYNDMHLIFFKVNINEVYLWEAIESKDISGIQQHANTLSEVAKEGLTILDTVATYKTDKSLVLATKNMFEFYIDEADTKVPEIADFLILNEDLQTIQTTLEKTPESKRTKAQINAYNSKIKVFNKAIKTYNKTNESLNKKRQSVYQKLNSANSSFLARHIPND